MVKHELPSKSISSPIRKKTSASKLSLVGRNRSRTFISGHNLVADRFSHESEGNPVTTSPDSRRQSLLRLQQHLLFKNKTDLSPLSSAQCSLQARRISLDLPPKKPVQIDDMTPQIPQRQRSYENFLQDFMKSHEMEDTNGSYLSQQNASWENRDPCLARSSPDAPPRKILPSYLRTEKNESVSAQLCSLANIKIQSSACLAANSFLQKSGLVNLSANRFSPNNLVNKPLINTCNNLANDDDDDEEDSDDDDGSLSSSSSSLSSFTCGLHPSPFLSNKRFDDTTPNKPQQIELRPGVWVQLRGARETWTSIHQRDFYLPVNCAICLTELCCIRDVGHVLCPVCHSVTSTAGHQDEEIRQDDTVGVGLTLDELRLWEMKNPICVVA